MVAIGQVQTFAVVFERRRLEIPNLRVDQAAAAIGEDGSRVQVQQLDFNAERGDLALNLQASDFSALESLRTRLQEAGLAVDMGSASREDNGVSARLVIGGNG